MNRFRPIVCEPLEPRLPLSSEGVWSHPRISFSLAPDGSLIEEQPSTLFQTLDAVAPRAQWQSELERALQTWAEVTPLNFHRVADDGSSSSIPGTGQQDPRFGDLRLSARPLGGAIVRAYAPGGTEVLAGDLMLDSTSTFSVGGTHDLYSVFLRGVGEALGVDYSGFPDPAFDTRVGLTAGEIAAVQALYGARQPDGFDSQELNNDLAHATPLTVGADGRITVAGDITSPDDLDVYAVTVPEGATGAWEISMNTRGISLLAPVVMVFQSSGLLVGWADTSTVRTVDLSAPGSGLTAPQMPSSTAPQSAGLAPLAHAAPVVSSGAAASLTLDGVVPGETYYLAARGASGDGLGMGEYQLAADFAGDFPAVNEHGSAGVLKKTWHSYLTRESADVTGMPDYASSDWSVEIALDIDNYDYIGDYGEFMRHGQFRTAFSASYSGWSIGTQSTGYSASDSLTLMTTISDGSGQKVSANVAAQKGRKHVVFTFEHASGTITLFIDGQQIVQASNPNIQLPAQFPGELAIGANNKLGAGYVPNVSGKAMPQFDMYLARVWSDDLTGEEVSQVYSHWSQTGQTQPPQGVTAEALVSYAMGSEVGDVDGNPGTGWLADAAGGNHLKIVDTNVLPGPLSSVHAPSGSLRGVTPVQGELGVSGAVVLKSDGIVGDGRAMQYYFEIDEASDFSSPDLRRSGWTSAAGEWQPLLKPSTSYSWRVKARNAADAATESNWSPVYSFTTRAPQTWYVRPPAEPGTYGSEDGTSYENAWNDLRWNGSQGGINLVTLVAQADFQQVAPADEVYVTDDWGLMESGTWSLSSTNPQVRMLKAQGHSAEFPIYVRMDHDAHPGRFYQFFRYTGEYGWVAEGNGVYSTDQFMTVSRIAVDAGGRPDIDIHDPNSDTLLYKIAAGPLSAPGFYYENGRMFVRMPDNASPENRIWYLAGSVETFGLILVNAEHVRISGGEFVGTSIVGNIPGSETTHLYLHETKIKYVLSSVAIYIGDLTDHWTLDGVEISYARNGVYGWNTGDPATARTGDYITVKNSYIHHIGVTGWENADAHAVGIQSGNGWVVEDNVFEHTGTAVEIWGGSYKEQKDHKIRRNVIRHIAIRSNTFGAGIAITGGSTTLGIRTGIEITDNVIIDTEGAGIESSNPDLVVITGNFIMNVGHGGLDYSDDGIDLGVLASQRAQAVVQRNVVYNPTDDFVKINGNGDVSGLVIDNNVYWADPPQSAFDPGRFYIGGFGNLSFAEWISGTPFDQNSVWGDPRTVSLPSGFSEVNVDFFMANLVGDLDRDGDVDQDDLDLLLAAPGGDSPALIRLMNQLISG